MKKKRYNGANLHTSQVRAGGPGMQTDIMGKCQAVTTLPKNIHVVRYPISSG